MAFAAYRYYCLDSRGELHSAEWFDAGTDEEAVAQIEAKHADATCEIWQDQRLVAKLMPGQLTAA